MLKPCVLRHRNRVVQLRTAVLAGSCAVQAVRKLSVERDVEPGSTGSVVAQAVPS